MAPDHQQDKIKKAGGGSKTSAEDDYEDEVRRVVQALGSIGDTPDDGSFNMIVLVRFDDYRNRQLTCRMDPARDTPEIIVEELIQYKFVSEVRPTTLPGYRMSSHFIHAFTVYIVSDLCICCCFCLAARP